MIAVYSFWLKPYLKLGGGYWNDRHLLSSLSYSALLSKQWFDKVVLYCSKELIQKFEKLKVFDEIIPCFEEIEDVPEKHWALSKMLVYSKQTRPFLHIDNDVYLLKKPQPGIFTAQLVAQSVETKEDFWHNYEEQFKAVDRQAYKPAYWFEEWETMHKEQETGFSYNAGVLGGTDVASIRKYALSGLDYMLQHGNNISDINTTIEQAYFSMCALRFNIKVKSYIISWRDLDEAREVGYRHFWGGTKRGKDPTSGKLYMDGVLKNLKQLRPEITGIINKTQLYASNKTAVPV